MKELKRQLEWLCSLPSVSGFEDEFADLLQELIATHGEPLHEWKALPEKRGIQYQHDVIRQGGTDAHAMQLSRSGVLAGGISIPTRYIHSSGEMCALKDVQATIDLVYAVCRDAMTV